MALPPVDGEPVTVLAGVVGCLEVHRRAGRQGFIVGRDGRAGAPVEVGAPVSVVDEPFEVATLIPDHRQARRIQ